jgi:hypothetical protein
VRNINKDFYSGEGDNYSPLLSFAEQVQKWSSELLVKSCFYRPRLPFTVLVMAPKDFEGITEEEQYELSRVVEGLQIHLDDVARRKEKNMDDSQAITRLHEDTTRLISTVDSFNQRPRPTKPTGTSKPLIDHKARHLIRELHELIEDLETLSPDDDEAAKRITNKGHEFDQHYSVIIADVSELDDIWAPDSMYNGELLQLRPHNESSTTSYGPITNTNVDEPDEPPSPRTWEVPSLPGLADIPGLSINVEDEDVSEATASPAIKEEHDEEPIQLLEWNEAIDRFVTVLEQGAAEGDTESLESRNAGEDEFYDQYSPIRSQDSQQAKTTQPQDDTTSRRHNLKTTQPQDDTTSR